MRTNLFSYTEPGGDYPGYVSINREDDGSVSVTVRAPPTFSQIRGYPYGCVVANCGDQVRLTIPSGSPETDALAALQSPPPADRVEALERALIETQLMLETIVRTHSTNFAEVHERIITNRTALKETTRGTE
jgi:hypothetical protein